MGGRREGGSGTVQSNLQSRTISITNNRSPIMTELEVITLQNVALMLQVKIA